MVNTHPIRVAADTVDANVTAGKVTETLLDALMKRTSLVLTPTETLSSYNFATGSPPYSVIYGQTGYVYFYNPDDTTTADDGSTCLVSADGRRYILADMSAMAISSVLSKTNTPPGSPTDGDAYVVDTAPTGAWVGHAKNIALYTPRGWVFAAPKIGCALLNQQTAENIQYNAAGSWVSMPTSIATSGVTPQQLLFPMGLSVEAQQNAPPGSPVAGDGLYYLVGLSPSGAFSGHSNAVAYYNSSSTWAFLAAYDGAKIFNKASDAELTWFDATGDWRPQWPIASVCEGRLTLATGTAITTTDQTAKATLYFTPFRGNTIALYTGGGWSLRTFVETSLSLSGYITGKPFDIFAYDNSGVLAIESLVWTNDTARATALTTQDGVYVKSGDATRRYLGTIYTTATGQTEDSQAKRMVWNYYNRVARPLKVAEATDTWVYSTATVRQVRASSANQVEVVIGVSEDLVKVEATAAAAAATTGNYGATGVGLDSTSAFSGFFSTFFTGITGGGNSMGMGRYENLPGVGRHFFAWLEWANGGTITWVGDNGGVLIQTGLSGTVLA